MANVIGIDIGGQSAKLGLVTPDGQIIGQCVVSSLQNSIDEFLSVLTEAIMNLSAKSTVPVTGIGIGVPNGNYHRGTVEYAPNLKWAYVDGKPAVINLAHLISEKTGIPVRLTNDANAAAMGEMTYGIAKGMKDFIMITLGTGVGSGIVIDGKIVYGHDGFAGELGHVCIVPDGRKCNCGLNGCLETYCSATGVARTTRELLVSDSRDSSLRKYDIDTISAKEVFNAAKEGDALAIDIFKYTGRLLGRAMADFIKFSAPQAIVLFGGLSKAHELFHDDMVKAMNDNLLKVWQNKVQVLYSSLKESDAAILGASALAW